MDSNGQKLFHGILELPLAVGVKGGVLGSNNLYNNSLRLLDFPSAQVLSEIMVCVGLAQNFGALRALAIEGLEINNFFHFSKNTNILFLFLSIKLLIKY